MSKDFIIEQHKEWLGYLQSESSGLVVAPSALKAAQIQIDKNVFEVSNRLQAFLSKGSSLEASKYETFLSGFFEWRSEHLSDATESDSLVIPEYHETVRPSRRLVQDGKTVCFLFYLPDGKTFEDDFKQDAGKWEASYQQKFERLLRDRDVCLGVSVCNSGIRITYAPKQETSGYLTFPISILTRIEGRSVLSACSKLLSAWTIFDAPETSRLLRILEESRKFQNTVSIELSGQVLSALYELVRGIDEAHKISKKRLLSDVLNDDPNLIYKGLLTVLLRLVFLLYAEDRDVLYMSKGGRRRAAASVFKNNYSLNSLYEQLRADAAVHLDTMNQRFGAWARLVSLFRAVYEGIEYDDFRILGRKGHLFDPERFPFLEGRSRQQEKVFPPPVSDGTVYRVLTFLLNLNGERISYRTLDVEQIGSVYETIMGFRLEVASGPSIAIKPKKANGAPSVIDLNELLEVESKHRSKWLKEKTDLDEKSDALKNALTLEEIVSSLERKVARQATPDIVPKGSLILQPSPERRKTGSHYTPRSLTEPIVRKALEPVIDKIGPDPRPEQIINLKICDPAMGSGAFLVEACRQLAQLLVKAWAAYGNRPSIPPDETELLFAQRVVARKCLYGVDKNPMAVDLAKLSLWLSTFASDHEFTFVDHNLKCGDSLVGLDLSQILGVTFERGPNLSLTHASVAQRLDRSREIRQKIASSGDETPMETLQALKAEEDLLVNDLRSIGDAIMYSYFSRDKPRARKEELNRIKILIEMWFSSKVQFAEFKGLQKELEWLHESIGLRPFHWECEFPEVFNDVIERVEFGFDAFVGNPPFLGGKKISGFFGTSYLSYLKETTPESLGQADLVAYFFRRLFCLMRRDGTLSLIATNTIAQGDTRSTALTWICKNGGVIYYAIKKEKWPGEAAVTISIVSIAKRPLPVIELDGKLVNFISPFLLPVDLVDDPPKLRRNIGVSFKGVMLGGDGFEINSEEKTAELEHMLSVQPEIIKFIYSIVGGDEILKSVQPPNQRKAIDASVFETETELAEFPLLLTFLKKHVERGRVGTRLAGLSFWKYERARIESRKRIISETILVKPYTSTYHAFTFIPSNYLLLTPHVNFVDSSFQLFALLQSSIHMHWAYVFGSSLEDRPRYTSSDCFETFPLPDGYREMTSLESVGRKYFEFRRDLMLESNEGLTQTYKRFHDPSDDSERIVELRTIHADLDRAVLAAFGWSDLDPKLEFLGCDDEDGDSTYRLHLPDSVRDQVLERLVALGAQYAATEPAEEFDKENEDEA